MFCHDFCHQCNLQSKYHLQWWKHWLVLESSSIFLLEYVTCWCYLGGSLVTTHLANWHTKVVRHDNLLSIFRLWYPEVASINVWYYIFVSFRNVSLMDEPLCTGLISAWLSLRLSRHRWIVLICFGTTTLLLHSAVFLPPRGMIISCSCRSFNSFSNVSCYAYSICLGGGWYGLWFLWPVMKMCLQRTQCLKEHHYMWHAVLLLPFYLPHVHFISGPTRK